MPSCRIRPPADRNAMAERKNTHGLRLSRRREVMIVDIGDMEIWDGADLSLIRDTLNRLIEFIPRANYFDADGTPRYVGSARAVAAAGRWTIDATWNLSASARLHGYYGAQHTQTVEVPSTLHCFVPFTPGEHVHD